MSYGWYRFVLQKYIGKFLVHTKEELRCLPYIMDISCS